MDLVGPKFMILGEQQCFVWDAASQSTKWLDMLNIWRAMGRWVPLGTNGYGYNHSYMRAYQGVVLFSS